MSSWRYTVKALHAIGGKGVRTDFDAGDGSVSDYGIRAALQLGLIERDGRRGSTVLSEPIQGCTKRLVLSTRSHCTYTLTQRGVDYCEGRITDVAGRMRDASDGRGPLRFVATWLASLPRDIRITQPEPVQC